MSADLPFTRDRANLIARAEQVATPCRVFRVEAHGSYHFCADCQKSEASHIIRALLDERADAKPTSHRLHTSRLWEIYRMVESAYISLLDIIPDGCGDEYQPLWDDIQKLKWSIEDELRLAPTDGQSKDGG